MVGIALLLKNRLKKTYGLTEEYALVPSLNRTTLTYQSPLLPILFRSSSKIIKYQPGKKTVLTDRSVTKKITDGSAGLPEWDLLPGIKGQVINVKGYQDQAIAVSGPCSRICGM